MKKDDRMVREGTLIPLPLNLNARVEHKSAPPPPRPCPFFPAKTDTYTWALDLLIRNEMMFLALRFKLLSLILLSVSCQGTLGELDGKVLDGAISEGRALKGHVSLTGSRNRFIRFQYDLLGRAVQTQHVLEGEVFSYTAQFGYVGGATNETELGSVATRMTFPDGEQLTRRFDAVEGIQDVSSQMPAQQEGSAHPIYNDRISGRTKLNRFAQVEWTDAGDNTRTLRTYDTFRRPLHVLTQKWATGEILQAFGYRYDKVGRVSQIRDYCAQTPNGIVCCDPRQSSCTEGPLSATYEYDVAGWLKKMVSPQGGQLFSADAIGNLVRKNNALQKHGESGLPHALTSVVDEKGSRVGSYHYNRVGSLVSKEEDGVATNFVWNANNMPMRTSKNGNVTERFYSGESLYKRVDTLNGKTSTTLFLPGLRIEDGTHRKFYGATAERESAARASRGTLRFYHGDHLGSSTLVTDEQGNPVARSAYFPFGEERFSEGSFSPKQQFTAKELEKTSGLYDYSARLYNPRTGRFISADSVVDGLNPYSYVRNNPLNLVDPTGHIAEAKEKIKADKEYVYDPSSDTYYLPSELRQKVEPASSSGPRNGPLGQEQKSDDWYYANGSFPGDPKMASLAHNPLTRGEISTMMTINATATGAVEALPLGKTARRLSRADVMAKKGYEFEEFIRDFLESKGRKGAKYNVQIKENGIVVDEWDAILKNAYVEVGLSCRGKAAQLLRKAEIAKKEGKKLIIYYGGGATDRVVNNYKSMLKQFRGTVEHIRTYYHPN